MIVNLKKPSTRYHSDKFHRAYGIQNWLCKKGYCLSENAKYQVNQKEYEELLKEFALFSNPNFDFSKMKHGIQSLENYVDVRFSKFAKFCTEKYKPKIEKKQ